MFWATLPGRGNQGKTLKWPGVEVETEVLALSQRGRRTKLRASKKRLTAG